MTKIMNKEKIRKDFLNLIYNKIEQNEEHVQLNRIHINAIKVMSCTAVL
jgi:hypothetical protein